MASGALISTDLAWHEGLATWATVADVIQTVTAPGIAPGFPAPQSLITSDCIRPPTLD